MSVLTGKFLIDYIQRNKLENAEYTGNFEVVLKDGTWLNYDPDETEVTHYDNPEKAFDEMSGPDYISEEEALKLREEIGEE